jgi:hypothetical protein
MKIDILCVGFLISSIALDHLVDESPLVIKKIGRFGLLVGGSRRYFSSVKTNSISVTGSSNR